MTAKHVRVVGDTLLPLNAVITLNGNPVDLSAYSSVKFQMEGDQNGTSEIAETASGVTIHPTQTFTASTTTDLLTCNAHGVKEGDQIVVANSGGALPTGLAAATRYYAVQVTPNSFALATLPSGSPIDITGAGTGTNTFYIVGSVQYSFSSGGVDTVGLYRGWFTIYQSTAVATFPDDELGIPIEIKALGN
jgi:hypothetical protein